MVFRLRRTYFTKDIFLLHFEVFKKEISNQYWILSHAFSIKNDRMIFFYLCLTRWWISSISFVLLNPSAFLQQSSLVRAFCSFSAKCISKVISPHPLSLPKRPALAPCDPLSPLFSLSRSTCQTRCSLRSSTPRDPQIPFPSACVSLPTQHLHTEALSVYCLLCKMDRNHLPILSLYPWTCSVLLCSDRQPSSIRYFTSIILYSISPVACKLHREQEGLALLTAHFPAPRISLALRNYLIFVEWRNKQMNEQMNTHFIDKKAEA